MLSLLRPLLAACLYLLLLPGGQGRIVGYGNGFHYQDISNGNGNGESRSSVCLCGYFIDFCVLAASVVHA